MSTAQVFQATRASLPGQATAGGVDAAALAPQFRQFMGQYDQPVGRNWFSHEISNLQGAFGEQHPELSASDLSALGNAAAPGAASNQAPADLFPEGQVKKRSFLGDIAPLLAIGGLAMGLPGLMSMLSGGAGAAGGLATGGGSILGGLGSFEAGLGMLPSFAEGSVLSGLGSFSAGTGAGLPGFMSSLGAAGASGAGMLDPGAWGGFDASQGAGGGSYFDGGGTSGFGAGGTEFTPPGMEGGNGGFAGQTTMGNTLPLQYQNFIQNNPWAMRAFSAGKGAFNNRDNPLMGAMMGLGNSFIPGTGGPFSNALGMGSGVMSMFQGMDQNRRMKGILGQIDGMGDPYAGLRQDAMSRLAALNSNPGGTLANLPGYKAGMDAITRQRAAMGQLGSGNLATALLDYGGNAFNQERGSALNQLAVAGDPARMGLIKAQLSSQLGSGNPAIMNGLATLGFGLNRMGL